MVGKPRKGAPRAGTSIRFSARDLWYIRALMERGGYGDTQTEVVRRFLWDGIRRARKEGDLPNPELPPATDIPTLDDEDD